MAIVRELITRIIFQTNTNGLQQAQQATNAFRKNINNVNNALAGLSTRWPQVGSNIQRVINNINRNLANMGSTTTRAGMNIWRTANNAGIALQRMANRVNAGLSGIGSIGARTGNILQRMAFGANNSLYRLGNAVSNASSRLGRLLQQGINVRTVFSRLGSTGLQAGSNIQRGMNGAAAATGRVNSAVTSLTAKLGPLIAAMGAFMSVGAVKNMADETMNLDNRLRTVEPDTGKRQELKGKLYDIAQDARTDYTAAGDLFFRVNRGTSQFGFNQQDALDVTEIVSKALTLGGASTSESQAAVLQLGQALGSGVLQGDELRSLNENASFLMQEMAKNMGVTISDLKEMGKQGELTSKTVVEAILKSGKAIREEYGNSTQTIGQSMQKIQNSFFFAVDQIEAKTHIFSRIAEFIDNSFQYITKVVKTAVALWNGEKMDDETFTFAKENPGLVRFIKNLKKLDRVLERLQNISLDFSFDFDLSPLQMISELFEKVSTLVASFFTGLEQGWEFAREYIGDGLKDLGEAWDNFMQALEPFMPFLSWLMEMLGTGLVTVGVMAFRAIAWNIKKASEALKAMGDIVQWVAELLSGLINKAIEALKWLGLVDSKNQGISNATWERAQKAMGMTNYGAQTTNNNQNYTFNVPTASDALYTFNGVQDFSLAD